MKKVWFGHQTAEELIGLARLELLGNSGTTPPPECDGQGAGSQLHRVGWADMGSVGWAGMGSVGWAGMGSVGWRRRTLGQADCTCSGSSRLCVPPPDPRGCTDFRGCVGLAEGALEHRWLHAGCPQALMSVWRRPPFKEWPKSVLQTEKQ